MLRLGIICILSLLANGENEMRLSDLQSSLFEAENYTNSQIINETSALFFGNTRAGRSTLINYLMGNQLKPVRPSIYFPIELIKADSESRGPEISSGSLSATKFPTKWTSPNLPNLTLWDIPGFNDNRGPVQDITNSFYFYNWAKRVKSLKIVLVIDINDIQQDTFNQLHSLLNSIINLFGYNFNDYFNSTSVIFTKLGKSMADGGKIGKEYVNYFLDKYLSEDDESKKSEVRKNFTSFILNNNDRIGLFRRNSQLRNVDADIGVDIFSTINNSECIESTFLQNVFLSISDSSMLDLLKSKELKELGNMTEKLETLLLSQIVMKVETLDRSNSTVKINDTMYKLLGMKKNLSALDKTNLLTVTKALSSMVDDTFEKEKFLKNVKLVQYVENKLNISISKLLNFTIESVILNVNLRLKTAISLAEVKLYTIADNTYLVDWRSNLVEKNVTLQNENKTSVSTETELTWWESLKNKFYNWFS